MMELVRNNQEIFIFIYSLIILWVNVSFIKDYKNIKRGLGEISSEDELEINPNAISLMFFGLLFNFFRRWLIYLLAILITENIFVVIISLVLFVIGLYDSIFNNSLEKLRKSKIGFYLAVIDTIFVFIFLIYLFVV
ncbi:hypothetical protein CWR45_06080 [Oceanobacillus chungangensis]|uniref:DUF4181 domain-containing protein n=2 Tax=Oceanobacillus chungangensis TaxID=1229152 RepID=A0A3D8PWY0_9BACI|nr:hypothetical protein CWR45_06080 [Oceanobacillus chungangensis]